MMLPHMFSLCSRIAQALGLGLVTEIVPQGLGCAVVRRRGEGLSCMPGLLACMTISCLLGTSGCGNDDPPAQGSTDTGGTPSGVLTGEGTLGSGSGTTAEHAPGQQACQGAADHAACDGQRGYCRAGSCVPHRCGDGVLGPAEQCDDGNLANEDGCQSDCRLPSKCGNGVIEAGESCDAGAQNGVPGSTCSAQCQLVLQAVCGNGTREPGEECDDGNKVGRDGCSSLCTHEQCGNKIVDALEECDDGNRESHDGCSAFCFREVCGDGILHPSRDERCDDGNQADGDGCDASCQLESRCGDGQLDPPHEICDDGNQIDGDGCSADCKLEAGYCGDGIAQEMEDCDDGNLVNEDGCSELCRHEGEMPLCNPIDSEPLPARGRVIKKTPAKAQFIYTKQLFDRYRGLCGGCHVDSNQGNFQTRSGTMERVASEFEGQRDLILDSMHTDKAFEIMPPGAKPLDTLDDSAPTVVLASQLAAWYDQGLSPDGFYWEGSAIEAHEGFEIDAKLSQKLSNIGSCEPTKDLLHRNQYQSQRMDAFFEDATQWPTLLSETDFISMDSEVLAQAGVVSYATTYELWADNAKKMRHFKLPYGKKIRFDSDRQLFELPENTRVYKTFLKEVKDLDGNKSYRKIETRVILVRKDDIQEDGTAKVRALFGSYKWNEEETEAVLVKTPLRNGKPFADDIFIYDVDEAEAERVRRELPPTATFFDALLRGQKNLVRHYAIPGSQRCVECHQGSLEENFVVGFSPLQLNRRPAGEGGVIEETVYPSELGQLERFIKWGLFENLPHLGQIKKLEARQSSSFWNGVDAVSPDQARKNAAHNAAHPDEKPLPESPQASLSRGYRNQYELEMQGYMLGNCAHCHNPRGFPSLREPMLSERLNLHPLAPGGGIYEFRLDNMSPRNERGGVKRIPVPYISPSIYDLADTSVKGGQKVSHPGGQTGFAKASLVAPWRSLIYRNVDTPYTYVFHNTVFPHMPVHTPGYDCRIRDLSAKWMLSIPSRMVGEPTQDIDAEVLNSFPRGDLMDPQPWQEVLAQDKDYAQASADATLRVQAYLNGARNTRVCRNRNEEQALPGDPNVKQGVSVEAGNIIATEVLQGLRTEPRVDTKGLMFEAHFTPYDLTDIPPPWVPRRADWATALVKHESSSDSSPGEKLLVEEILGSLRLDQGIRDFAMTPIPLGFWETKPQCSFEKDKRIKDLPAEQRWQWMQDVDETSKALPLYYEAPGATIFKAVCAQCHGRKGDSEGLMANLLNELTGGESRVADFKSGFFGPVETPGSFMNNVFGADAKEAGLSVDDLAAQYMTWMSLGGTRSRIHSAVLSLVNATRTMGKSRQAVRFAQDANMLNLAKDICESLVNIGTKRPMLFDMVNRRFPVTTLSKFDQKNYAVLPLIDSIADAELWTKICTYNNPMPIRILAPYVDEGGRYPTNHNVPNWLERYDSDDLVDEKLTSLGGNRLASSKVGFVKRGKGMGLDMLNFDGLGVNPRIEKMTDATVFPTCVRYPPSRFEKEVNEKMKMAELEGKALPYCPEAWIPRDDEFLGTSSGTFGYEHMMTEKELQDWALRGAANAGLMVYAFTKALITGETVLEPDYNFCEERKSAP